MHVTKKIENFPINSMKEEKRTANVKTTKWMLKVSIHHQLMQQSFQQEE